MGLPTVSAAYATALIELVVSKGVDRWELLEKSGLSRVDLDNPDARVLYSKFVRLMRNGIRLTGEPALGLHFGEYRTLFEISIVGQICYTVETAAEAWAQLNRYSRLVMEVDLVGKDDRFQFRQRTDGIWMVDTRDNPNDFPELTEAGFARMICEFRKEFPETPYARAIRFSHPQPSYIEEYRRVFDIPLFFDARENSILINEEFMALELAPANKYVFGIFSEHADRLLKQLNEDRTTKGKVESILIPILHTGELGMDAVALRMGISRQTLYRKLKSEGIEFKDVVSNLRCAMAINYLDDNKVSVHEIAYLVGYSDPTTFSKAFKRWTGQSPLNYRKKKNPVRI